MSFKRVLLFFTILFVAVESWSAAPSEVYDLPDLVALQNRVNYVNQDMSATMGYLPSDAFNKGVTFGLSFTNYYSDYFGWEIVNAHYSLNLETNLKNELLTNFPLEIEGAGFGGVLDFIQYYATTNIVYTPFYNKSLLFNSKVVRGETSFVAGGGMVKFADTGFKPLVDAGFYMRYFRGASQSLKFDMRINLFFDSALGLQNFLSVMVSYSWQLGSPPADFVDPYGGR